MTVKIGGSDEEEPVAVSCSSGTRRCHTGPGVSAVVPEADTVMKITSMRRCSVDRL